MRTNQPMDELELFFAITDVQAHAKKLAKDRDSWKEAYLDHLRRDQEQSEQTDDEGDY